MLEGMHINQSSAELASTSTVQTNSDPIEHDEKEDTTLVPGSNEIKPDSVRLLPFSKVDSVDEAAINPVERFPSLEADDEFSMPAGHSSVEPVNAHQLRSHPYIVGQYTYCKQT